jgi:hypothetical protein
MALQAIFKEILERDPEGGLQSFYELMNDQITMPACMMTDGRDPKLFDHFSVTAQKIGVCECWLSGVQTTACLPACLLATPGGLVAVWVGWVVEHVTCTQARCHTPYPPNHASIPSHPIPNGTADTAVDYANIMEYLVDIWDIEHMSGLSGEAVRALLGLAWLCFALI